MCGFLHRLLPKAKGAETLIADMVRINLQNLPELPAKGGTASELLLFAIMRRSGHCVRRGILPKRDARCGSGFA